ncbi:MAG: hypothetical protein LDL29_06345, partial [Dechloromonas sp.]|nr:hypothetical protein [Dechloromonas sp.]
MPSLEIAGLTIGVREAVLALIVLVALYIAVVLWRMRRLGGMSVAPSTSLAAGKAEPTEIPAVAGDEAESTLPDRLGETRSADSFASSSDQQMVTEGLARELAQLRDEVDAMRGELAALREDMLQEVAHLRAAQTVSPIYGDAVQMAAAGYDAAAIAE